MIKAVSIFTFILLLFTATCFSFESNKVTVQLSIPSVVKPGEEFGVFVLVNKGSLRNAATLQQYLPEGFTATVVDSQGANFIFEDHKVKFTWLNLPAKKSFTVSYVVKTDTSCNGLKIINGEFFYNENDNSHKIKLTPSVILVSNNAAASKTPDEWDNEMQVEKKIGPLTAKAGEYQVELKIKKGFNQHAVRIFDQVMEGYSAYAVVTKGARFSAAEGVVEFYWETLPEDSVFSVLYNIVSDRIRIDYSASNLSVPQTKALEEKTSLKEQVTGAIEKGIYYKVQIAATVNNPGIKNESLQSFDKINKPVDVTLQNGWKIYSIGTFEKYDEAKRCLIETQAKIPGAFVVAYLNGNRIPLQDALKINK